MNGRRVIDGLAEEVHRGRRSSVMPFEAPLGRVAWRIAGFFPFAKRKKRSVQHFAYRKSGIGLRSSGKYRRRRKMGLLVEGVWHDVWYDTKDTGGRFVRSASQFRNFVTADGSAGPSGKGGFKAESGRYHLYVSLACPWAHRTLIFRKLKGLEEHISVSVVHFLMLEKGWEFREEEGATPDHLFGASTLADIYTRANPTYSGRVTVPVLWDKQTGTIVSNESAEIIRMFNSAFDGITGNDLDFYPEALRAEIDELNAFVYDRVNNGVYKCGFATTQSAYEENFEALFHALDTLDGRLAGSR
jgi:putative glutathione S-transferase